MLMSVTDKPLISYTNVKVIEAREIKKREQI